MENKQNQPMAQSDNHSAVKKEILTVKSGLRSGGQEGGLQHPAIRRRFKVYAHMDVPVGAEVTLEADTPEEAHELVRELLIQAAVREHLWELLHCQKIRLNNAQSNQSADVEMESVLLDFPPEVLVWDSIDLDSGKHCGPGFQIGPALPPPEVANPAGGAPKTSTGPTQADQAG